MARYAAPPVDHAQLFPLSLSERNAGDAWVCADFNSCTMEPAHGVND